jgi:signal transduction histidine kinase
MASPALERAAAERRDVELAFALATRDGELVAGDPRALAPEARVAALAPPLDGFAVRAVGLDLESYVAGERRRAWLVAAVVCGAMALATAAAIAGARAVSRESRLAREREAFVAAVTHELKAPLASIRLLAELIERGGLEEAKAREFGARTVTEADRLSRLVSSVLQLAKLERAPRDGAARERFDLADAARDAIATFEPAAKPRGFSVELRAPRPAFVDGDRDALVGAVIELLDNAAKHARDPHALEVEVEVLEGRRAALSVLDRGAGVPAGEARRIFEPFHRAGDEMTRERPGVGLGLAIVQRVAEAHGGVARYAPRDGGGSRFSIELPLARP